MSKEKSIATMLPRENPQLVGHVGAQAQFMAEAKRGVLHHAYLMTGAKGIGKATLAYHFARYILSRGAVEKKEETPSLSLFGDAEIQKPKLSNPRNLFSESEACSGVPSPLRGGLGRGERSEDGTYPTPSSPPSPQGGGSLPSKPQSHGLKTISTDSPLFRRVATGSHTDLLILEPAYDAKKQVEKDTISVEDARKVPDFLRLTPAESEWRVVIVDAVDQLNTNAANALLKILEEPPARAILFLICHRPGAILSTIRSRCRQFALQSPSRSDFEQILRTVAPSIMMHEYDALYALANGSPGYAITLHNNSAIQLYRQWLESMQPEASLEIRRRLADVATQKSPETWQTLLHCWQTAITRINLWPHLKEHSMVFEEEVSLLERIASPLSPDARAQWHAAAARLIADTETFNLDKRQSISMLLSPSILCSVAA